MTHPSAAGAVPPSRHRVALALVVATAAALSSGAAIARQDKARKPVEETPRGPMTLIVSIADQSLSVYDGEERIARVPVSTGQKGYETPTGVFSIIQKNRIHFSNLYNEAPMPFMQRITWSGVALHAGNLPGYPASHGCIRMPHDFAQHLFGQTRMGARVIVSRSGTAPERFSHAILAAASIAPRAQVARSDASPASAPVLLMRLGATSPETAAAGTGTAVKR